MLIPLLSVALAGELLVVSETGVVVEVDGRSVSAEGGERGSLATGLAGGTHRVQVFDTKYRLLASATADVRVDEQVRLELRRGGLVELGRGPLAGACPGGETAAYGAGEVPSLQVVVGAGGARVEAGGPARLMVVAPAAEPSSPPPPPAPVARVVVSDADFVALSSAIAGANFSSDQIGILRSAVRDRWFTVAQVGALLDEFTHSSDKVEAAGLLAPHTVDPQNAYQLDAHLSFSSDRDAVRKLYNR